MKLFSSLVAIAICSGLSAEPTQSDVALWNTRRTAQPQECCPKTCCEPMGLCDVPCGYNCAGRFDVCDSWDMFANASFIYWQGQEESLGYAVTRTAPVAPVAATVALNARLYSQDHSDYKPGFKVGLGFNSEFDDWGVFFEYTRLNYTNSESVSVGAGQDLFPVFWWSDDNLNLAGQRQCSTIGSTWKMNLNLIDMEVSRTYYVGKRLIFRSHMGARGGWLDQNFNVTANFLVVNNQPRRSRNSSDSWFVGPRAGIDTNWLLACGFRAIGNASAAIVYTKYDVSHREDSVDPAQAGSATFLDITSTQRYSRPQAELALGFGWGSYFWDNRARFDLAATYDFNVFWSQKLMSELRNEFLTPADLFFHGLTVTAQLDF